MGSEQSTLWLANSEGSTRAGHPHARAATIFAAGMTNLELERSLRSLRRTVLMLQTELRHGRVEAELLNDIDQQMERGIATDERCAVLIAPVDTLRENTLTPRAELLGDTIRACDKLMDAIAVVLDRVR